MRSIHILILSLAFSWFVEAQSFDCKLAASPREHSVCSDKSLAASDRAVSAAFKSLRAQLSPEAAAFVQSDEREWLQWLDAVCPAHGKGIADDINRCLASEYRNRERDLKRVVRFDSTVIFPRNQFVYKAGNANEPVVAGNDPGFGYGVLRWPQIDVLPARPNAAYADFNGAVRKRASKFVDGVDSGDKNAAFPAGVDASGTVDGFYVVKAANDRFIDVTLFNMSYGWGAAHPNTNSNSFLWWFDHNRELTIEDVFLPHSGWQDKLTTLAVKNLRSQPGLQEMLGDDIDKTVKATLSDPTNWTLTRDGLTVTFGQYAIGPYAIGMPEAQISWSDLKLYLAPGLQPATLPAPAISPSPWALN